MRPERFNGERVREPEVDISLFSVKHVEQELRTCRNAEERNEVIEKIATLRGLSPEQTADAVEFAFTDALNAREVAVRKSYDASTPLEEARALHKQATLYARLVKIIGSESRSEVPDIAHGKRSKTVSVNELKLQVIHLLKTQIYEEYSGEAVETFLSETYPESDVLGKAPAVPISLYFREVLHRQRLSRGKAYAATGAALAGLTLATSSSMANAAPALHTYDATYLSPNIVSPASTYLPNQENFIEVMPMANESNSMTLPGLRPSQEPAPLDSSSDTEPEPASSQLEQSSNVLPGLNPSQEPEPFTAPVETSPEPASSQLEQSNTALPGLRPSQEPSFEEGGEVTPAETAPEELPSYELPAPAPVQPEPAPVAPAPAPPERPKEAAAEQVSMDERLREARRTVLRNDIREKVQGNMYGNPINPDRFFDIVTSAGVKYNHPYITSGVVTALCYQESTFDLSVSSPVGAQGICQFMPATAAEYGIDASNPDQAVDGTYRYLIGSWDQISANFPGASYEQKLSYTLASYNAGMGNVLNYGGVPPFNETITYVNNISNHLTDIDNKMQAAEQQVRTQLSPQMSEVEPLAVQSASLVREILPAPQTLPTSTELMARKGGQWEKSGKAMEHFLANDLSPQLASALTGNLVFDDETSGVSGEAANRAFALRVSALQQRFDDYTYRQQLDRNDLQVQLNFIVKDLKSNPDLLKYLQAIAQDSQTNYGVEKVAEQVSKAYIAPSLSESAKRAEKAKEIHTEYRALEKVVQSQV